MDREKNSQWMWRTWWPSLDGTCSSSTAVVVETNEAKTRSLNATCNPSKDWLWIISYLRRFPENFLSFSFFYIACIYQKKVEMVNVSVRNIFLLYLHSH